MPLSDPKRASAETAETPAQPPAYACTHCTNCGYNNFPQAEICPKCWSTATNVLELSQEGVLYSFSSIGGTSGKQYVGYVDLPEEIRVFGLLNTDARPECGLPVKLSGVRVPQGAPAFVFDVVSTVGG